jgi:two-component system phosphate regulon sensor histidine kinase PhoR
MGLKKIFPVIFLLITLSLIGIIYIQINWIVTMIENKREELNHHMIDAVRTVAEGLGAQRASPPSFKSLRLKPGTSWRPTDPLIMEMMRMPADHTAHLPSRRSIIDFEKHSITPA